MMKIEIREKKMYLSQSILITSLCSGLVLQPIIILFSFVYIIHLMKLVKRNCIELENAKYYAYPNSEASEKTARQNYKKNMLILAVLVFEMLYRILGFIDYVYVASKQSSLPVAEYQLSANCTLKSGTALALYFQWGTGYNMLVGANWASLLFLISLLSLLTEHLTNTMFNPDKKPKRSFMSKYIIFSIVKCVLIQIVKPIPILYIPALIFYILALSIDFSLMVNFTIRLYRRLKSKCIAMKYHGSVEELAMLKSFEENIKTYKYFSIILMTGFAMQIVGENILLLTEHVYGSVLENLCFYEVFYGIGLKGGFPLDTQGVVGMLSEIATNVEFFSRNLLNITLIIAYSVYSWRQVVKTCKQVRVYRYHVEVKTSIVDPFIHK